MEKQPLAFVNGDFIPADQAAVSVFDAGFMLGATVAEQLRTFRGELFRLQEHLDRLTRSLAIVGVDPGYDRQALAGVLTDAELVMIRYSSRGALALRGLKAIYYGTVINCVVMAFVLVAAVRIFEIFLPWNAWLPAGLYQSILSLVSASGLVLSSGVTGLDAALATTNNVLSIITGITQLFKWILRIPNHQRIAVGCQYIAYRDY